jgi:ComF family protein
MRGQGMGKRGSVSIMADIWQGIVDLLYPPKCLVCGEMQPDYLCAACIDEIIKLDRTACPKCALPRPEGTCTACRDLEYSFDSAASVGVYEGVLKDAIHQLKYSGHRVIAPALASLMVQSLRTRPWLIDRTACIVPVPIHPAKERQRGFNQSELIARDVARVFAKPMVTRALARRKQTLAQVELSGERRRENTIGIFEVVRRDAVEGRNVMLVDDVFTTGSTVEAAAFALREAGAREVHVVTLARSL